MVAGRWSGEWEVGRRTMARGTFWAARERVAPRPLARRLGGHQGAFSSLVRGAPSGHGAGSPSSGGTGGPAVSAVGVSGAEASGSGSIVRRVIPLLGISEREAAGRPGLEGPRNEAAHTLMKIVRASDSE